MSISTEEFLQAVQFPLAEGDAEGLARAVRVRWRPREVATLLRHQDSEMRRLAAVILAMVGDTECVGPLTRALYDDNWRVHQMAEHALWSVWFRACDPQAVAPFRKGLDFLGCEQYDLAISCLNESTAIDPHFAEAYNQCAIAHFMNNQWRECVADSRRAIKLMPCHFGAMAGLGHCFVQTGEIERAVKYYRRALKINPRMPAIARAVNDLQTALSEMLNSSGQYDMGLSLS
jgi:tetratricopeptide (TPR) repeat protein